MAKHGHGKLIFSNSRVVSFVKEAREKKGFHLIKWEVMSQKEEGTLAIIVRMAVDL